MATPRHLNRPPIVEALVDFQVSLTPGQEELEEFVNRELRDQFPNAEVMNALEAKLEVLEGKVVPPKIEDQGFHGIWSTNTDKSRIAQFRRNGFTLNHVGNYVSGDSLIEDALKLWSKYTATFGATHVDRVALRYINKLGLPYKRGDDFDVYLTAAPPMPPGTPQLVTEFLTRVVTSEPDATAQLNQLIVTQRLVPQEGRPLVLLDIDVFRLGSLGADDLPSTLESLRLLKNRAFFAMLTEAAIALYA